MSENTEQQSILKPRTDLIADAFSKAQGKFKQPELNRKAEIKKDGRLLYTTLYADLNQCIECVRQSLSDNNLSFTQTIESVNGHWMLVLTLRHGSGQSLESFMPLNLQAAPQVIGGQLTYLKRYQISAFFGLAADFDDDGNAGSDNGNTVEPKELGKPRPAPKPKPQVKPAPIPQKVENSTDPDPADFIIPFGSVKGKKLSEVPEATLKQIREWANSELKKGNSALGANAYEACFNTTINIDAFLQSMGVS